MYLYISDNPLPISVPDVARIPDSDTIHVIRTQFGIDDARLLVKEAYLRPVLRHTRVFLVSFHTITIEAQNALLKLLEEPPASAEFHIVVRHKDVLLPTLRSRLIVAHEDDALRAEDMSEVGSAFFALPIKERLTEVATRTKAGDTAWAETLLQDAERYAARMLLHDQDVVRVVLFIRKYFGIRGSSPKMLLEELALSFPQTVYGHAILQPQEKA